MGNRAPSRTKMERNNQRGREGRRANIRRHTATLVTDCLEEAAGVSQAPKWLWCWSGSCGRDGQRFPSFISSKSPPTPRWVSFSTPALDTVQSQAPCPPSLTWPCHRDMTPPHRPNSHGDMVPPRRQPRSAIQLTFLELEPVPLKSSRKR